MPKNDQKWTRIWPKMDQSCLKMAENIIKTVKNYN